MHYRARLQEIKSEYSAHVREFKQLLTDYRQTKLRLSKVENVLEGAEVGEDSEEATSNTSDRQVKVFSSDVEDVVEQEPFVVINRDLEHLKQQSQEYIKKQDAEQLFKSISDDIWRDYIDTALIQEAPKAVQVKKPSIAERMIRPAGPIYQHKNKNDLFSWPVHRSNFWLSSLFGNRKNGDGSVGFHYGIDMAAMKGTPVYAAATGVVVEARNAQRGYGNTIVVKHSNKYKTRYAHLDAMHVCIGQRVLRGAHIGDVGDTGFVRKSGKDASHLHFELYVFGERVNPLYYLA